MQSKAITNGFSWFYPNDDTRKKISAASLVKQISFNQSIQPCSNCSNELQKPTIINSVIDSNVIAKILSSHLLLY